MQKVSFIIVLLFSVFSFSQEKYEYVIVPAKYEFLNEANKYGVNALTKSFFESQGYTVFYDTDEFPIDLAKDRCKALFVDAIRENKLFTTNITIQIKDCQNKLLIESFRGSSREKSYEVAYKEAFRFALTSLKGQVDFKNSYVEVEAPKIVEVVEITDEVKKPDNTVVIKNETNLTAVPFENGYKLVDSSLNIIYTIQNTSVENVFMAQKDNQQGTFLKKINGWFFDYYQDGRLVSEKVSVKF